MASLDTEEDPDKLTPRWILDNNNEASKLKEIIATSGISVRLWRLYAYFWLICLLFPLLSLIQTPPSGYHLLITASGLIIFVSIYFCVMWSHPLNYRVRARFGFQTSITLIVALIFLVLFLSLNYGSSFLWLFIGVSAIAGITLSFRNASIVVIFLTLLTVGANVFLDGSITSANWLQIIPLALLVRGLGLDMIGFVRLSDALRELQSAREELAHLAVAEERFRMARDLHDLLGHTLSLITLKSELASRLLEKDRHASAQEVREVEQVARQALREMREAVARYRQRDLHGELGSARQILEAAGVICTIEYKAKSLPSEIGAVLAWVVREGVTNVIRHSRAQNCLIRIISSDDHVRVEVSNDGCLLKENSVVEKGSGLSGLAERVASQGGQIEAEIQTTSTGTGFLLRIDIPVESRSEV
jgi:two-component system sensor histidine kinase DesK